MSKHRKARFQSIRYWIWCVLLAAGLALAGCGAKEAPAGEDVSDASDVEEQAEQDVNAGQVMLPSAAEVIAEAGMEASEEDPFAGDEARDLPGGGEAFEVDGDAGGSEPEGGSEPAGGEMVVGGGVLAEPAGGDLTADGADLTAQSNDPLAEFLVSEGDDPLGGQGVAAIPGAGLGGVGTDPAPENMLSAPNGAVKPAVKRRVLPEIYDPNQTYDIYSLVEYSIDDIGYEFTATVSAEYDFSEYEVHCTVGRTEQLVILDTYYNVTYDRTGSMGDDAQAIVQMAVEAGEWMEIGE